MKSSGILRHCVFHREALPGYKIVGIDCNEIITASGAIHCITKAVSSEDALLISHQPLDDLEFTTTDYLVDALIKHADGISDASLFWSTDTTAGYTEVAMTLTNPADDTWTGYIPYQSAGEKVFYYVHAEADNGKQQVRPITAPYGYWMFRVLEDITSVSQPEVNWSIWPNPTSGVISVQTNTSQRTIYTVLDARGKTVQQGSIKPNTGHLDLSSLSNGLYLLKVEGEGGRSTQLIQLTK